MKLPLIILSIFAGVGAQTLVSTLDELRAAVASDAGIIDIVANLDFQNQGDEVFIPKNRTLQIMSTTNAVLSGGGISRFFVIAGTVSMDGLSMVNGRAAHGGAIAVTQTGHLKVSHSTFAYNRAMEKILKNPRKVNMVWGAGGAIYAEGALEADFCVFTANSGKGGALWIGDSSMPEVAGSADVSHSTFEGNKSPDSFGGAVVNYGSTSLTRCRFAANYANTAAAAVFTSNPTGSEHQGSLSVHGCFFEGNKAEAGSDDVVVIHSGEVTGDISCSSCEASRTAGSLANGFCEPFPCNGCPSALYSCSLGKGHGIDQHQEGRSIVWW